jgi:hypothetical protein
MSVGYCSDPYTEPAGKLISRGSDEEEFESGIGFGTQAFAGDIIPLVAFSQPLQAAEINAFDNTRLKYLLLI